jgi:Raf kinase inhibitor-like YbhB/YbcL family protein
MVLELRSSVFNHEGSIPDRYTCRGEDVSPPLQWTDPPEETVSFALLMSDLDTPLGVLSHWVLYNIPCEMRSLPEAIPHQETLTNGSLQGRNGTRKLGYMGPCPPFGNHRYVFDLYALDKMIEPHSKMTKRRLLQAMENHILGQTRLMGHYSKKP